MTKKINKTPPVGASKPIQQCSFDIGVTKQRIREILVENGVAVDSIQPRYLSNFIDGIIESLKLNRAVNKDTIERSFRKEILQKQIGIDKSQINFGGISIGINQLKSNLPVERPQSLTTDLGIAAQSSTLAQVGTQRGLAAQGRLQGVDIAREPERIIEKILLWAGSPLLPSEVCISPGFAEVRRGAELSTIQLPKRTNPEVELRECIRQMPRDVLEQRIERIITTLDWYMNSFMPAQSGLTEKFLEGQDIQGREVIEALDEVLRTIAPAFNIREIIHPDSAVTRSDLINVGNAINSRILMPRGVFSGLVEGGRLSIGFTLRDPEILVTPKGRNMPMHVVYPFLGEFGYAYSDHGMLVYPYHRDDSFARGVRSIERNWINYKLGLYKGLSFLSQPGASLINWIGIQFLEHSEDIVRDQRIDAINEELSHHDFHSAFEEKERVSFDTQDVARKVQGVKKLLKPGSILLEELGSLPQREQYEFCNAIDEIYAKLASLERSPFPLFTLQDCIINSILTGHEELQSEPRQYAIARKFLAQFIWKELNNTPELQDVSCEEWCRYFDTAIKGADEARDKEAVRTFNKKLIEIAPKIISEHFVV